MGDEIERYIKSLRRALRENQEALLDSIRALAAAIDAKNPYTRSHSEHVARSMRWRSPAPTGFHIRILPRQLESRRSDILFATVWFSGALRCCSRSGPTAWPAGGWGEAKLQELPFLFAGATLLFVGGTLWGDAFSLGLGPEDGSTPSAKSGAASVGLAQGSGLGLLALGVFALCWSGTVTGGLDWR